VAVRRVHVLEAHELVITAGIVPLAQVLVVVVMDSPLQLQVMVAAAGLAAGLAGLFLVVVLVPVDTLKNLFHRLPQLILTQLARAVQPVLMQ